MSVKYDENKLKFISVQKLFFLEERKTKVSRPTGTKRLQINVRAFVPKFSPFIIITIEFN